MHSTVFMIALLTAACVFALIMYASGKRLAGCLKNLFLRFGRNVAPSADPKIQSEIPSRGRSELAALYERLITRVQATPEHLVSSQAYALLSMAFNLRLTPDAFLIYELARVLGLTRTKFYTEHKAEVANALSVMIKPAWLLSLGADRIALQQDLSREETIWWGFHHFDTISYYDPDSTSWRAVPGMPIRWRDGREVYRKLLNDWDRFVEARQKWALSRPRVNGGAPGLRPPSRDEVERYLRKLEATRDFDKEVFGLLRKAENTARESLGLSAVGQGWISEMELLCRVRRILPGVEVLHQGRPPWLGRQHLDIYIPSMTVAIEYQGIQHFEPVSGFGGEEGYFMQKRRDARKRKLCDENGLSLVEIAYDKELTDGALWRLIHYGSPNGRGEINETATG